MRTPAGTIRACITCRCPFEDARAERAGAATSAFFIARFEKGVGYLLVNSPHQVEHLHLTQEAFYVNIWRYFGPYFAEDNLPKAHNAT